MSALLLTIGRYSYGTPFRTKRLAKNSRKKIALQPLQTSMAQSILPM